MLGLGRNLLSRKEPWSCSWPWDCVTQGLQSLSHCRASHSAGLTKTLKFTAGSFKLTHKTCSLPLGSHKKWIPQNIPWAHICVQGCQTWKQELSTMEVNGFSIVTDVIKQNIININNIPGTQTDKSCSPVPGLGRELSSLWSHQSSWGSGRTEGLAALPCPAHSSKSSPTSLSLQNRPRIQVLCHPTAWLVINPPPFSPANSSLQVGEFLFHTALALSSSPHLSLTLILQVSKK